ncbi:Ig-like domain-containing protein [Marinicella sediminis]|uniref:Ig-like domain-containing protein n=1 Tax=Marinicella sediminis TaxID=1792834 RepID=A0ABV7JA11_9GAMM|nr:Ig-like domain-containing protein [Marinicella sediminis]
MKKHICYGTLLVLLLTQISLANAKQKTLYTIDPAVKSRLDAVIPINQSVEEWDISFDVSQVTETNKVLNLQLPVDKKGLWSFSVTQTTTRLYDNGDFQWAGTLGSAADAGGTVIFNIIGGQPYGLVMANGLSFEIYTDPALGTRLARTESKSSTLDDLLEEEVSALNSVNLDDTKPAGKSHMKGGVAPGVSVVDVLVVIDDDLYYSGSPIFGKIQNEKMNADYILANSGPNAVGVPVRLNLLPYQPINVPAQYQNITFVNGQLESYSHMTDEQSALSLSLMQMQENSGADYVALYIPFDPDVLGTEACGVASIPRYNAQDINQFRFSFSLHASTCNADQFVFLHELMHNFGSAHIGGSTVAFEPYARGYDIWGSVDGDFSTLMGCTQTTGTDPSDFTCNRIPHLSTPEVVISGQPIGRFTNSNPSSNFNADNVRFLTECAGYDPVSQAVTEPCRRYQMATKGSNTNPVDSAPTLAITSPLNNQLIEPVSSFQLSASVSDDYGVAAANWTISDLGTNPPTVVATHDLSVSGTNPNINLNTPVFNVPGSYLVSARVTDTAGQQVSDSHQLTVNDDDVPVIILTSPGEGQYFAVGEQVTLQAQVVDDNPINQVSWTVYYQNLNQPVATGVGNDSNYSFVTQPLTQAGHYLIEAEVVDSAGQPASVMGSFNIDAKPVVSIIDPAAAAQLVAIGGIHSMTATASDDRGPVSVFWEVENAYTDEVIDSGFGNRSQWTFVTNALTQSGHYVLRATATDVLGQTAFTAIIIELIESTDVQSSFSFFSKDPLPRVTVTNTGDISARHVVTRHALYKHPSVVGQAAVSQLPAECVELDPNSLPFVDPNLAVMYECQLPGLGTFDWQLDWDLICLETPKASLLFTTELVSINGVQIPGDDSNSSINYGHQFCNY